MSSSFKQLALTTAIIGAIAVAPLSVYATNGNLATATGQSARGVGGAGIAYPQDTLALGINPASGVTIGNRMDLGLEIFSPDRDLTLGGRTFDGNETDTFLIPEFGYNRLLDGDRSIGISVSGAGGQNTDYAFHPLLGGPAMINLSQLFIQPTFSMKRGSNSFGASLNLVFQQFEAEGLGALAANSFDPGNFTDNGTSGSTGAGISLGWMGEVSDTVSIGATYQSKISMSEFDEYRGLIPGGSIDIAAKYGVGIAVAASDKLDVLFDFTRVAFSDTLALGNSTDGDRRSPLGFDTGPGFGWSDINIIRVGVVYKHSPELTFRAGVNHGDNPVPNETFNDAFFNSLTPAVVQDHISLGFTKQLNAGLSITGSYVRTLDETLNGNGAKLTAPGAGTPAPDLRMDQNAIGITVSWLR